VLVLLAAFGVWQARPRPIVHITNIALGWVDSEEEVNPGPTDKAPAGKIWAANVDFTSTIAHQAVVHGIIKLTPAITNEEQRIELENNLWDRLSKSFDTYQDKAYEVSTAPARITLFGKETFNSSELEGLSKYQSTLYVLVAVQNKDSRQIEAAGCGYRYGISPLLHECHDHNFP